MDIDSKELTEFIKQVAIAIDNSKVREMMLKSGIEFELSVIIKKEGNGKLRIFIADANGDYEKESVSKIKFSLGHKPKVEDDDE